VERVLKQSGVGKDLRECGWVHWYNTGQVWSSHLWC